MLDSFLKVMGDYGNPTPRFTGPRCLVERMAVGGCDRCQEACPHEAITIERTVQVIEANCTSCGLCVQACPTGALEFDTLSLLNAVHEQTGTQEHTEAVLVCSQAGESGKTITCLARVTPSVVVAAGGWDWPLTLVHGDCASCPVGSADVPDALSRVITEAERLREATGRPARVTVRQARQDGTRGESVSRRRVFGALFRGARKVAADLVPDNPLPFVDWSVPQERTPTDWLWRRRALKPTPAPEANVYWPAPTVNENCISCPVCANVCPTEAITRDVQFDGSVTLHLDLAACTGCGACASSCPPEAITLSDNWQEAHFAAPVLLFESDGTL